MLRVWVRLVIEKHVALSAGDGRQIHLTVHNVVQTETKGATCNHEISAKLIAVSNIIFTHSVCIVHLLPFLFSLVTLMLSPAPSSLLRCSLCIKSTPWFISCVGMIDMSYLWEMRLSDASTGASFLSDQTLHTPFLFALAWLAHRHYQRRNLSHAIMAENKGDEVYCREETGGSKDPCELWLE